MGVGVDGGVGGLGWVGLGWVSVVVSEDGCGVWCLVFGVWCLASD